MLHLFHFGWLYKQNNCSYTWNVYDIEYRIIVFSELEAPMNMASYLIKRMSKVSLKVLGLDYYKLKLRLFDK